MVSYSMSDSMSDSVLTGLAKSIYNSLLDLEADPKDPESSSEIDRSRKYLTKCVEEITYLMLPPSHPPVPQPQMQSMSSGYMDQDAPMSMEEVFLQQRQNNQHPNSHGIMNHRAPTVPSSEPQHPPLPHMPPQSEYMNRDTSNQPLFSLSGQLLSQGGYSGNEPSNENFRSLEESDQIMQQYRMFGLQGRPEENRIAREQESGETTDVREVFLLNDNDQAQDSAPTGTSRPDQDQFPSIPVRSPPRTTALPHRRKSSGSAAMARRRSQEVEAKDALAASKSEPGEFKVRFALRGHLDVVRSVIFTGGGSPSEPEICSAGDDGMIKRWIIPASYSNFGSHGDLDIQSFFTHRGHEGVVTSLAAAPATANFATGGRASGDGWIFSGGQDSTIRVWERGRVDPKATLKGHEDAVWALCVLPGTCATVFGAEGNNYGGADRILIASGSADGTVKIWAASAPPQLAAPQTGSRRGVGGSRRHSVTSGSNYPSSPQPSVATTTPFHYTLVHTISRPHGPSPTCISPLSPTGGNFVVSYNDASIVIFDTRTAEEIRGMASNETYDGTPATGINAVVAAPLGMEAGDVTRGLLEDENVVHGATGSLTDGGVEGVVISGHEDQFIQFFDANSGKLFTMKTTLANSTGQCTYRMLAHPSAISSLSLNKDGREAVSAGHDASIRFWSLEKRVCTQEITSHRVMRGEGVCSVVWSQDGRFVVSAGGDGVVKVFAR
jgi:striatin 1/3/4